MQHCAIVTCDEKQNFSNSNKKKNKKKMSSNDFFHSFVLTVTRSVDFSGTRSESGNSSSPCCVLGLAPNIAKRALRHRARSFVRNRSCFSSIPSPLPPPPHGSFTILIFPRCSSVPGCRAPFTLRSFVFLLNFGGAFSPRIESLPRSLRFPRGTFRRSPLPATSL